MLLLCPGFKCLVQKPQARSHHTPSAGPGLPNTELYPHGSTTGPPKGLVSAGGNTGGGSVCACQRKQYILGFCLY